MTIGVALMFGVLGAGLVVLGRTDRGQGRLVAGVMQAWGAGLVAFAGLGAVAGAGAELPVVGAGVWFLGGIAAVLVAELAQALRRPRRR